MQNRRTSKFFTFCCLAIILLLIIVFIGFLIYKYVFEDKEDGTTPLPPETASVDVRRFTSEDDFRTYLRSSADMFTSSLVGVSREFEAEAIIEDEVTAPSGEEVERVSGTTVQVRGIDEPDIVKTDGTNIYFSQSSYGYYRALEEPVLEEEETAISPTYQNQTKILKAFPVEELDALGDIAKTGNLLLYEDTLVIFEYDGITAYDVTDPTSATKLWDLEYGSDSFLVDARLYEDQIYLVTETTIDTYRPCPINPVTFAGSEVTIQCTDIYHPITGVPVDATYTVMVVDIEKGESDKEVSFVGASSSSIVYMSTNALYITYSYYEDFIEFYYNFFTEKCQDLVPSSLTEKLKQLQEYDISASAKYVEFEIIVEEWMSSLDDDTKLEVENEMENRMDEYYEEHKRDLERTGVVKVGVDGLEVLATSSVPGQPLNQFSLDESGDYLRVATTIGQNIFAGSSEDSVSDVYVLDSNLEEAGSVKDLGEGERIYSVRFIQDKGYVVTFKQIDPFFVLDLSEPTAPELKGELKIPGYSSYLHPLTTDRILGVGKEGANVKLSLFDVSSPDKPVEASKYELDEYWSDVLDTHHAFLQDSQHGVFFMPGSKGGYIFSYEDDELKLEKAVSTIQARRSIYINDYMYIIGEDEIVVLDESDWSQVGELELM